MLFYDETLPHYNQCNFVEWKMFCMWERKADYKNHFWSHANNIWTDVINVQWITFHNIFTMLWIVFESHYIKSITKIKYLHEGTIKHEPKITSKRVQTLKEKLLINLKQKKYIIGPLTSSSNEYFTFFSSCNW